jgi:Zinc finger, C3HC4 type (RING finger)
MDYWVCSRCSNVNSKFTSKCACKWYRSRAIIRGSYKYCLIRSISYKTKILICLMIFFVIYRFRNIISIITIISLFIYISVKLFDYILSLFEFIGMGIRKCFNYIYNNTYILYFNRFTTAILYYVNLFWSKAKVSFREEQEQEEDTCIICYERDIDTFIKHCGHLAYCSICAHAMNSCAVCRVVYNPDNDLGKIYKVN